jgi:hypothetical protein
MSQVWAAGGLDDKSELLVLLALADWADDAGECYPSIPKLAEKARMSERNVRYMLAKLRDRKLVEWTESRGRGRANCYRVLVENLQSLQGNAGGAGQEKPAKRAEENLQTSVVKPAKALHPILREPSVEEPSQEPTEEEYSTLEPGASAGEAPPLRGKGVKVPVRENRKARVLAEIERWRVYRRKAKAAQATLACYEFLTGRKARGAEYGTLCQLAATWAMPWIEAAIAEMALKGRGGAVVLEEWMQTWEAELERQAAPPTPQAAGREAAGMYQQPLNRGAPALRIVKPPPVPPSDVVDDVDSFLKALGV